MPDISVIMSVYNGEKFLDKAIESILNQSFENFEFIIVNDGSSDSTEKLIFKYKDPRIVYLKNEINIGLAASLNRAIEHSRGKYIARMDDDDISSKDRFKKQYDFIENHQDIGVVGSIANYITEEDEYLITTKLPEHDYLIKEKLPFFWFHHGSVIIRKEHLIQVGGYDAWCRRIEDLLLWNKLSFLTKFYVIQEPLYTWRLTVKGATNVALTENIKLFLLKLKNAKTIDEVLTDIKQYDIEAETDQKQGPDSKMRQYQYLKQVIGYALTNKRTKIAIKYYIRLLRQHFKFQDSVLFFLKIIKSVII